MILPQNQIPQYMYVRLPGGSDLEDSTIHERFIWNNTIGLLENRSGRSRTWTGYNTEDFGLIELRGEGEGESDIYI
jgi:alpha-N-arabinofuranosidase